MARLSQGEAQDEPPFKIVPMLSDRARGLDQEVRACEQAHPISEVERPSELKREKGLQLIKRYGIAICTRRPGVRRRSGRLEQNSIIEICGYLNVMRQGEKLPMCGGCGERVWARLEDVIFQHDNLKVVKTIVSSVKGWQGRGGEIYRLPTSKLREWARRHEKRIEGRVEVEHFFAHMPWNLTNFRG